MDPVITVRWIIKAPIIIVAYDDRIGVVPIMTPDPVARDIAAVIDKAKGRARVIIERTVSTPIIGARRVMPEIVPTIMMAIVIAIIVAAIVPVEIAVMAIVPIMSIIAVTVMAIGMPIAIIMIAIMIARANVSARLAVAAIV